MTVTHNIDLPSEEREHDIDSPNAERGPTILWGVEIGSCLREDANSDGVDLIGFVPNRTFARALPTTDCLSIDMFEGRFTYVSSEDGEDYVLEPTLIFLCIAEELLHKFHDTVGGKKDAD